MTTIAAFKNALIPAIKSFCNVPIIVADQIGDRPVGAHATIKITSPYIKGVGQAEEIGEFGASNYQLRRVEQFKRVLSFTAYDMDADVSHELAQQIHDWFSFHGSDWLGLQNIVVAEQSAVSNRDGFVLEDYERRNGFDVTLRMTKEIIQTFDYIENLDMFEDLSFDYEYPVEMASLFEKDGVMDQEYTDSGFEMASLFETDGAIEQEYTDSAIDMVVNYQGIQQPLLMAGSIKIGQTVI